MYRVTGFSPSDIKEAVIRGDDLAAIWGTPNWDTVLAFYANHYAITLWHGDEFVSCGGVAILWSGVGEAWVIGGKNVEQHGREVFKTCKRGLDAVEKNFNLRRMQATILSAHVKWIKFAKVLGFVREGIMFGYGPDGKDYIMAARYRGWDRQ